MITALRCAVCHTVIDVSVPLVFRCPKASLADPYHVLRLIDDGVGDGIPSGVAAESNAFVRYGRRLAWWAFARANGMSDAQCEALTRELADGFTVTPFEHSAALSDEVGAELWLKDETGNVAGSHKGRHLVSILLHLRAAELVGRMYERPPLAIASCGNAAVAAATLARRVDWPLDVYVPDWVDEVTVQRLTDLGASVHRCERREGDPPGDPAMLRFREATYAGAIPFSVQGPENAYCLDGGRTIGWEIADQAAAADIVLDRIVVQVGGGALAACVGAGLGRGVRLDTVQAEGCAPLADTWERLTEIDNPERYWPQLMRPWPNPHSVADGILDDETYDWIADVEAMVESGGRPIVAPEPLIEEAHALAYAAGYRASHTGTAGLAGVLTIHDDLARGERVAIVLSGASAA